MTVASTGSSSMLAQMRQLQQAAFKTADVDGDGKLSQSEFDSIGQNVQGGGNSSQAATLSSQASSGQGFNSDTLSTLISLLQTIQSAVEGTGQTSAASTTSTTSTSKGDQNSLFTQADTNGDGQVTADELSTALSARAPSDLPAGAPSATDIAARMIKNGDTNGDGSLSASEMAAMKPQHGHHGAHGAGGPPPSDSASASASGSSTSASSTSTDPADTNGDGVVSAAELANTLSSASTKLSGDVSSSASDMMKKLLDQLNSALTTSSGSSVAATA